MEQHRLLEEPIGAQYQLEVVTVVTVVGNSVHFDSALSGVKVPCTACLDAARGTLVQPYALHIKISPPVVIPGFMFGASTFC